MLSKRIESESQAKENVKRKRERKNEEKKKKDKDLFFGVGRSWKPAYGGAKSSHSHSVSRQNGCLHRQFVSNINHDLY